MSDTGRFGDVTVDRGPGYVAVAEIRRPPNNFFDRALIDDIAEAATRQHTPKVAYVSSPVDHVVSSGKEVTAGEIDLLARALSMGLLHHAMMGTAAVATSTPASAASSAVSRGVMSSSGTSSDRSVTRTIRPP